MQTQTASTASFDQTSKRPTKAKGKSKLKAQLQAYIAPSFRNLVNSSLHNRIKFDSDEAIDEFIGSIVDKRAYYAIDDWHMPDLKATRFHRLRVGHRAMAKFDIDVYDVGSSSKATFEAIVKGTTKRNFYAIPIQVTEHNGDTSEYLIIMRAGKNRQGQIKPHSTILIIDNN